MAAMQGSNTEILARLEHEFGNNPHAADGIARLRELVTVARDAGIAEERIRLDLSIARGLDYYTGTIYETFLTAQARTSAASVPAAATTTSPACTPSKCCRASAHRSDSIVYSPRWRR